MSASLARARLAFNIDVSFGDPVEPDPAEVRYPALRGGSFTVVGSSLSTVVAEKVASMLELGDANTRDRDFGDIYRIASRHRLDARELRAALQATARYRGIELRPLDDVLRDLAARRQSSWTRWRARSGVPELPPSCEQVLAEVIEFVDPVLSGEASSGVWDPAQRRWRSAS